MKRLLSFLSLLLLAGPVLAAGRLADVAIYDRADGRNLPVYESGGHWFVAGRPGNEYRIIIRNRDRGDLLAVVSVDGVNVVTGETAASAQSGYVVEGGRTLSIAGWRKSLEQIAAFYFTDPGDSYAALTGRPGNLGVIGVALFRRKAHRAVDELEQPKMRAEAEPSADRAPRSAASPGREKKIATGHGESQNAPARYVRFDRESELPAEVIAIHYDTYANLLARGIVREQRHLPVPFPGSFVPDPPDRG
jgi:hypothetical protein